MMASEWSTSSITGLKADASELRRPPDHVAFQGEDLYGNQLLLEYHGGGTWSFVLPSGRSFIGVEALAGLADKMLDQAGELTHVAAAEQLAAAKTAQHEWEIIAGYFERKAQAGEWTVDRYKRQRDEARDELAKVTRCSCGSPAAHLDSPEESADWACRVPNSAGSVDDDLLRDIGRALGYCGGGDTWGHRDVRELLASEPMQRLRAAWTAEALGTDGDVWSRYYEQQDENVELAAEVERLRVDEAAAMQGASELRNLIDALTKERDDAWAAVERLRAAVPDLPDVGPVEWDDGVLMFDDGTHWHPSTLDWRERDALREVAQVQAGRAFLDREAEERVAAEAQAAGHRCDNCEGVDPATCLFNVKAAADTTTNEVCMSRGPRIGGAGTPHCKQPMGHDGHHAPAPEDGWDRTVVWSDLSAHRARTHRESADEKAPTVSSVDLDSGR